MHGFHLVFPLLVGWFFQSLGSGQTTQVGCRNVNEKVLYTVPYAHAESGPKDGTVLDWLATGSKSGVLTVFAPALAKPRWYSVAETFTTTDFGANWDAHSYTIPSPFRETEAGYRAPSNPKVIYRHLRDSGLYLRSEDGGETWVLPQHLVEGVSSEAFAARVGGSRSYHVVFTILAVHPRRPLTLYAEIRIDPWAWHTYSLPRHEQKQVYVSEDGGENWKALTDALQSHRGWAATWAPPIGISPINPSVMFGQSNNGLVKSMDGGISWKAVGHQAELHQRPLFESEQPERLKARGFPPGTQMIGYPIAMEITQFLFHPANPDVLYVVSNKGVHRTKDGGNTWVLLGFDVHEVGAVNSAALNPLDPAMIVLGTKYGLFLSSDEGCHFREIRSPRDPEPEKASAEPGHAGWPPLQGERRSESSIF